MVFYHIQQLLPRIKSSAILFFMAIKKEKTKIKAMKELLNQAEQAPSLPQVGELVGGVILKISKHEIVLDLGPLGTGVIYGKEIKENRDMIKDLKQGDKISALVMELENEDGYTELSLKEANLEQAWADLKQAKENDQTINVKIVEANRGGLVIRTYGIVGFLPVSQLSPQNYPRVEGGDKNKILSHLNQFIGKEMEVKVLSLDKRQDKLVVSEKAVKKEEIAENLKKYNQGDIVEGTVTALADFGAFIKFDQDLEGLAHISELDWQIIDHPKQILKENDQIKAQIIDISNNQVSLSLRALKQDPWEQIKDKYQNGQKVKGKVVKISPNGAFVEISPGIHGLIHNAEFNNSEKDLEKNLKVGEKYTFEINSFSPQYHKMTLNLNE